MEIGAGTRTRKATAGFTLMELVIGLVIAALAGVAVMTVFSSQNKAADSQRENIDTQQNARAALDVLVRELRQAGANVDRFHQQQMLVDAAPYTVTFNADIRSGVGGDPAMESTESIPRSDGTVYSPGAFLNENLENLTRFNNGAETIRFSLDANGDGYVDTSDQDTMTKRDGDFRLVRQVNTQPAETVAYGLRGPMPRHDGSVPTPMLQYRGRFGGATELVLWGDTNGDGQLSEAEITALTPIPDAELPNVREIVLTVETLPNDVQKSAGAAEASSTILKTTIRPRNIGMNESELSACGQPPLPPTNLVAKDTPDDGGRSITLTFDAAFDDGNGENDVSEYYIYRRRVGEPSFGSPIYKIPASKSANYMFINDESNSVSPEDAPVDGVQYEYYVTAWDCEPQESNPSTIVGPVTSMPNGPMPPTITDAFDTPCDGGSDITVVFTAPSQDGTDPQFTGYRLYRGTSPSLTAYKIQVLDINASGQPSYTVHDTGGGLVPLSPDSTYYYVVRSVRAGIESVDSNQWGPVFVSDGLAKPVLHTVEDVTGDFGTTLLVKWDASPSEACMYPQNVQAYALWRKSQYESGFSSIYAVVSLQGPGTTYAYKDSMLTPDVYYDYKVSVYSSSGEYEESNILGGKPTAENQLQPPINVLAEDVQCDPIGAIRLSWTASPNDVTGEMTHYRIFRGTQTGVYDLELPMVDAVGQATYTIVDDETITGANAPILGVRYYYMARSFNTYFNIESSNSNESNVLAESVPTAPEMVSIQDTPDDQGRSITVRFDRSAHDGVCDASVTTYNVYRGTSPGVINVHVGTVTAMQQTSYTFYDDLVYSLDPPMDGVDYYYGVRAFANELVSKLSNVMGPVQSIENTPAINIVFEDDFETDKGWTTGSTKGTNDWQKGTPQGKGSAYGNPDPTSAVSGSNVWGNALNFFGSGRYRRNSKNWLRSPKIDCTGQTGVRISFKRWLNVERPARDKADIQVRTANTGWTRVWRNPAEVTDNGWTNFELDISAIADGQQDVEVRFWINTNSSRQYTGWNIDDFMIIAD